MQVADHAHYFRVVITFGGIFFILKINFKRFFEGKKIKILVKFLWNN